MPLQSPYSTAVNVQLTGVALGAANTINLSGGLIPTVSGGVLTIYSPAFSGTDGAIPYFSATQWVTTGSFEYDYARHGVEAQDSGSYLALGPYVSGAGAGAAFQGGPVQEPNLGQLWFHTKAGRTLLNVQGPFGADQTMQSHLGQDRIYSTVANTNATTLTTIGGAAPTVSGTAAAAAAASTNFSSSLRRIDYPSAAVIGQGAHVRGDAQQWWVSNIPGAGGFYFQTRFIVAVTAAFVTNRNTRLFAMMSASTGVPALTDPSASAAGFGVIVSSGGTTTAHTNYTFFASTGTSPTLVDSGIPYAPGDVMDVRIYAPPSGTDLYMSCQKLNPTGSTILAEWKLNQTGSNFPPKTTFYNWYVGMATATSGAVRLGFMQTYMDSDY